MKKFWGLLVLVALGGCAHPGPASISTGECKVFDAPPYVIRGATQYDQDWIDPTIESGVGACGWKRPEPRPAEWDAPVKPAPVVKVTKKPKKKGSWLWRAKWPMKAVKPVVTAPVQPPAAVPVAEPDPAPAPLPAPRSPIDELLSPQDGE